MSEAPKRRIVRPKAAGGTVGVASVLEQFHCHHITYEFSFPFNSFNTKEFFKETGMGPKANWTAAASPKDRQSGYHVHLRGRIDDETLYATIEYWNKGKPQRGEMAPFAETIMEWIGRFVNEPTSRALAVAWFRKPKTLWKSRFNLPFKVTMADAEVVIDGVSLIPPKNAHRALGAYLAVAPEYFAISIGFAKLVEFAKFNLRDEIVFSNEAVKMFMEEVI